ncbi:MAG TPA: MFS transporter [Nocardioides sp.]|nr:MFS transporter [Nocardioides sp.]
MYRRLFHNGALVRALLSFGAAYTAEWAFTVAISLVAYADGGAVAVGLVGLLRLVPAALLAPAVSTYADRLPREKVLFASSAVRGLATVLTAPILIAGGPTWVVYGLAIVSTIAFTPYRASHSALMPLLCRAPEELTSINVVRGLLDSFSVVVGPFVAAVLVSTSGVASVFVFAGVCGILSAVLVLGLTYERVPVPVSNRRILAEIREGVRAVSENDGVWVVFFFVVLQTVIRGAFTVFVVVVAIDLLGRGESEVGVLQGAVGIGALIGSAGCTLLVGSRAMTRWLAVAVVLWGVPLAVIGVVPEYAVALAAAAVIGVGNAMVDVTAFTLVARMVPDAVLARVFGLLESLGALGVGLGSLVAPLLVVTIGARAALVTVGLLAPVACVLLWWRATSVDRSVDVRTEAIDLFRRVPMLRPLPVTAIEQLAQNADRSDVPAGVAVFEAGETGDSFYVVEEGRVEVLDSESVVRTMGPGEGFGEIALLGNTTRTMTVRAVEETRLLGICATDFLPAVTGISEARTAAEDARAEHLRHAPGRAADDVG